MTTSDHKLELLSTALDAYLAAERSINARLTADNAIAHISATNRLFDAAMMCGMDPNEPNESKWASSLVASWLMAA